jgi:uncharacterized membrane protein YfcA
MQTVSICFLVFVASIVGTITGFGLSTIMVPVLAMFYPFDQTLVFVGIIHWFSNLWKLILFRGGFRWRLIVTFGVPGIFASFVGASLMFDISQRVLPRVLGMFIIVYVIYLLVRSSFKVMQNTTTAICGGALSGFFAGIFGIGGAVRGMFLSAFDLPKAVYIATAGAIALAIDTTRLTTYIVKGAQLEKPLLWVMPIFITASFLGAQSAKHIVEKIPQKYFRVVVAVFLMLAGLKLLIYPS